MASEPNENNISCSVCGVPLNQPSPLCGAYTHPEPPGPLDVGQRIQDQKFSEFLGDSISKVEIHPDKWHDHTMKAIVLPSKWDVGPPPSPEEIKAQQLMYQFVRRIERMNLLFQIGAPIQLTNLGLHRLQQFKMVISDEVSEGCDLIQQIMVRNAHNGSNLGSLDADPQLTEDEMVAFADWLGDLVVYVFSEAARWGIDLLAVLKVIMDSQDSKLSPDGKPIHDPVTNKFLKGPNYVAPEAAIKALMFPSVTGGFGCASHRPSTDSPTSPPEKFECPHCGYRESSWVQDGATYFCSRCLMYVRSPDPRNDSEESVCTCKPDCPPACKGSCGCDYCLRAYSDSLEGPE